jgi:predicted nucleotidyltransferase
MELQKQISLYFNNSGFPSLKNSEKSLKNNISKIIGKNFSDFREVYESYYKNRKVKNKKIINNVERLQISNDPFLKPLKEFKYYVNSSFTKDEILGVYVHGSLATGDYIKNYSDFDALIIIKKEVFNSEKKMKTLRKKIVKANTFLYLLDPLQHHELFIISEFDMNYYFEPIFPLELFKYAKEVTNFQNTLKFRCLENSEYLKKQFLVHKEFFFQPEKSGFNKKRVYYLKNFVQNILLFPSIYYQLKNNKAIYKKYSFERTKKDFTENEWKIVKKCTQIRISCPYESFYSYFLRKFIGLNFHYKFLKLLHRYFDKDNSRCMLKILGKNYLDKAKELILKMEKILKENGKI